MIIRQHKRVSPSIEKKPEAQPKVEKKSEHKRRERQQKIEVTEQLPIDVAEKAKKILEEIEEEVKSENE